MENWLKNHLMAERKGEENRVWGESGFSYQGKSLLEAQCAIDLRIRRFRGVQD